MRCRFISLTFLVAAAALLSAPAFAAREQVASTVDPAFFERPLKRIAIFQVITPVGADERVLEVPDMVQAAMAEQGDFDLLFPDDFKAAVERGGAKEEYATLQRVWLTRRELEPAALEKIATLMSIDAIVIAEVTHFEQFKIDYTQEGNSTTTVGLKVQMFGAHDRKPLWDASFVHVAKSVPYNPSNTVVEAGGEMRQGIKNVPEPPEYVVTAQKVVNDVFKTYPKPKEEKDGRKKAGDEKKKDKEADKHE